MAAIKEEPGVKDRLSETIRDALRPHVVGGKLDILVEALVKVLRSSYVVGIRRPRPRRETQRALSMRLPDVGVTWTTHRKDRDYTFSVVGEHALDCEVNGVFTRYESLKAAAVAVCGYSPSVGGWQFFFGSASRDEVNRRKKP